MPTSIADHPTAVDRIADHLADRDAFLVLADPDLDLDVARRLSDLDTWTAYAIDDRGLVVITDDLSTLVARSIGAELLDVASLTVFAVPKTVPAVALGAALGFDIPADGSQDVIVCHRGSQPMAWPMVFVDALRRVDPKAAAVLEANSLANLS